VARNDCRTRDLLCRVASPYDGLKGTKSVSCCSDGLERSAGIVTGLVPASLNATVKSDWNALRSLTLPELLSSLMRRAVCDLRGT
jgi:hypothetical protein